MSKSDENMGKRLERLLKKFPAEIPDGADLFDVSKLLNEFEEEILSVQNILKEMNHNEKGLD